MAKEGWLKKKSPSAFGGQQKRWFVLKEAMLYYYKDQSDNDPKGVIPLRLVPRRSPLSLTSRSLDAL